MQVSAPSLSASQTTLPGTVATARGIATFVDNIVKACSSFWGENSVGAAVVKGRIHLREAGNTLCASLGSLDSRVLTTAGEGSGVEIANYRNAMQLMQGAVRDTCGPESSLPEVEKEYLAAEVKAQLRPRLSNLGLGEDILSQLA